jgi:hypothetical protein
MRFTSIPPVASVILALRSSLFDYLDTVSTEEHTGSTEMMSGDDRTISAAARAVVNIEPWRPPMSA